MDEYRNCYWCGKKIESKTFFCSEKCRHEYNTTKGTSQEMFDLEYLKFEARDQAQVRWIALTFFLGLVAFFIGMVVIGNLVEFEQQGLWIVLYGVLVCVVGIGNIVRLIRAQLKAESKDKSQK